MDSSGSLALAGAMKPQPPLPTSVGSTPSFTRGAPASSNANPASAPTTDGPPSPRDRATLPARAAWVADWSSSVSMPSATGLATSSSSASMPSGLSKWNVFAAGSHQRLPRLAMMPARLSSSNPLLLSPQRVTVSPSLVWRACASSNIES